MVRRQILLYGTSANPPTALQGHMGVVNFCQPLFDEIWILPVYQHIYSTKRHLAPFEHRVRMCQLAIQALPTTGALIKVQESEKQLVEHLQAQGQQDLRTGTIDLVEFLLEQNPDASFTLLLGGDTYADLRDGKWKRGDELLRLVYLLVMQRKGFEGDSNEVTAAAEPRDSDRVRFVFNPALSDISSTTVRAMTDVEQLREAVGPAVAEYITTHKLFGFAA